MVHRFGNRSAIVVYLPAALNTEIGRRRGDTEMVLKVCSRKCFIKLLVPVESPCCLGKALGASP